MERHDNRGDRKSPDLSVMEARVGMLFEALSEIKTVIKGIDDTVSIIRVFEHQLQQHGGEIKKLEADVREMRASVDRRIEQLEDDIAEAKREALVEATKAKDESGEVKGSLDRKLYYVRGAIAGIAVLGGLLYACAIWWATRYIEMTDAHSAYIQKLETLRAEDHLREHMYAPREQPKSIYRRPVQVDSGSDDSPSDGPETPGRIENGDVGHDPLPPPQPSHTLPQVQVQRPNSPSVETPKLGG